MARGQRKGFQHTEESKLLISQGARGAGKGGFNVKILCDNCHREMSPANLAKHRPVCLKYKNQIKEMKYLRRVARVYGLTLVEYESLRQQQNGLCYICHKHESEQKRALSVDHSHTTGKVRKLLCDTCNHLLGNAKDDVKLLRAAIAYLEEHKD